MMIMHEIIVNAENQVAGRMASKIAKELLKGSRVYVINAESAVISGSPEHVLKIFKEKHDRGDPYHGPFYPRRPDAIIKRMVRGMLPKNPRGTDALSRLRVYISIPNSLQENEHVSFDKTVNRMTGKVTKLGKISEKLGAKKTWQ